MSIKVTCLQCGATNNVNDRLAGKRVRCPECDTAVHVPESDLPIEAIDSPAEAIPVETELVEIEPMEAVEVAAISDAMDVPVEALEIEPLAVETVTDETVTAETTAVGAIASSAIAAMDFDDDDDDDTFAPRKKMEDDELDMTSMVDVTFLLLIFFVVTASFQLQKSIMMPRQQTDAPSTSAVEEDPEELDQVELQIDERGAFLVLAADWEAETPGKQNLISKLKEALGDNETKLIIKVQEQAKLQSLVDGMDAGTIAGYTEIEVTQVEDFD